jgi:hypothetical protein
MLKSIKSTLILSIGNSFRSLNISNINLNKCIISLRDFNNHSFWLKKHKNIDLNFEKDVYLNKELINLLKE